MATVARLLPRHWDGRRLLQFLTGLALIALAFTVPALLDPADQPADAPVTIITTVDTPVGPGLPVTEAPDQAHAAGIPSDLALGAEIAGSAEAAGSAEIAGSVEIAGSAEAAGNAGSTRAAGSTEAAGNAEAAGTAETAQAAGRSGSGEAGQPVGSSAVQGPAGLPVQGRHGGRVCVEARAAVGGSAQRAHSERGPPRA